MYSRLVWSDRLLLRGSGRAAGSTRATIRQPERTRHALPNAVENNMTVRPIGDDSRRRRSRGGAAAIRTVSSIRRVRVLRSQSRAEASNDYVQYCSQHARRGNRAYSVWRGRQLKVVSHSSRFDQPAYRAHTTMTLGSERCGAITSFVGAFRLPLLPRGAGFRRSQRYQDTQVAGSF